MRHGSLVALLLCLTEGVSPTATNCPGAALAHASVKVRPEEPFCEGAQDLELHIAGNEYESFQVLVNGATEVQAISVEISALAGGPSAAACAAALASNVYLHAARYIHIDQASDCDGAVGWWPDALVPFRDAWHGEARQALPATVPTGENRAFWVDVFAEPGCEAGVYRGRLDVASTRSDGTRAAVPLAFTLRVFGFDLPSTSLRYRTTYGLTTQGILMGAFGKSWKEHANHTAGLLKKYLELGLMHRVSFSHDGGPLADPALKSPTVDWEDFALRWEGFLAPSGHRLPFGLRDARLTSVEAPLYHYEADAPGGGPSFARFLRELWSHASAGGWAGLLFNKPCDEPHAAEDFARCRKLAEAVHSSVPRLQVLVTTDLHTAREHNATQYIDALCPVINFVHSDREHCSDYPPWSFHDTRPEYSDAGYSSLWWYQSCMSEGCDGGINRSLGCDHDPEHWPCRSGWPSYMIDAPALMNRAMSWLSYVYNITGELYWRVNFVDGCTKDDDFCNALLPDDVWGMDSWNNQLAQGGNGDGQLTYPGRPDVIGGETFVPVASMRLKHIRDGLEDVEYLYLLEDLAGRVEALRFAHALAQNTRTFTRNVSLALEVRARLGAAIESGLVARDRSAVSLV